MDFSQRRQERNKKVAAYLRQLDPKMRLMVLKGLLRRIRLREQAASNSAPKLPTK